MKINIITQPLFSNYGGILQNFALQETLKRMGHEPLTINIPVKVPSSPILWKDLIKTGLNFVKKIRGEYNKPFLSPYKWSCKEHELSFPQREFIEKHVKKVDVLPPFTSQICESYPADAWIVGSDQVWRPWCSHYIENCFFDFVNDNTKRIAYAASFGTDQWEISSDLTKQLKPLAQKFDAISVRESSGVNLCKKYLDVNASHVLDPTMLLTAEDYLSLTKDTDYPSGEYIATYILDYSKTKQAEILRFAKAKNLPIVSIGCMRRDGYDSIESWLATIAKAQYVITDSFHGTVFSILFGRPMKILKNDLRGNARIESIFRTFNLDITSHGLTISNSLSAERLNLLRELSIKFLIDTLNQS